MRAVLKSALTAACLLAVVSPGAHAQQDAPGSVRTYGELIDLGVYDLQSGAFGAQAPGDGAPPTLVFNNTDASNAYYNPTQFEIDMDQGILPAGSGGHVVAVGLSYATPIVGTVDLDIRIHSATDDLQDPGTGIIVPLRGMPGALVEGQATGYTLVVSLPQPYLLPAGPIRFTYQTFDPETGPVLCLKNNIEWGTLNRLERYNTHGVYLNLPIIKFSSNNYDATFYMQLYTRPIVFDDAGSPAGTLARRDRFSGTVEPGATDVLLYEAVAGERLKLGLVSAKNGALMPHIDVVEVAGGQSVASAGAGETKVNLTIDELPASGTYQVRVSGLENTSGEYTLRVAANVPKSALKPQGASAPSQAGSTLVAFVGKPGDLLNAVVKPVAKQAGLIDAPVLAGPVGTVDLGSYLTLKGNSTWVIKKLPLPVFGAYALRAGVAVGPGTLAKARIKSAKPERNRVSDIGLQLAGTWLMEEFVTPGSMSLLTLDQRGKQGESRSVRYQDQYTFTREFQTWKAAPADDVATTGARLVTWKLNPPVLVEGLPPVSPPTESSAPVTDRYVHQQGDPNTIVFNSGVAWRRDFSVGPAAPDVMSTYTDNLGSELPDGQAALQLECVDGAAFFDIYRAPLGTTDVPFFPVDRHRVACTDGYSPWVDAASVGTTGFQSARYWVRAVDATGNMGPLSSPVDVTAP